MITLLLIMLLTSASFSQSDYLDFKFYGTSGKEFNSLNLKTDIDSIYEYNSNPVVLLYVTNSLENLEYKKQLKYLSDIDAEELQLMFVDSNTDQVYNQGYHTDIATASRLLGNDYSFRILLLNGMGKIICDSKKSLTAKEIIKILKQ